VIQKLSRLIGIAIKRIGSQWKRIMQAIRVERKLAIRTEFECRYYEKLGGRFDISPNVQKFP